MPSSHELFLSLCQNIQAALQEENWETLAELDAQCRSALMGVGEGEQLTSRLQKDPALGQALVELQQCYQVLLDRCQQHRDQLRTELSQARLGGQASRAYTQR